MELTEQWQEVCQVEGLKYIAAEERDKQAERIRDLKENFLSKTKEIGLAMKVYSTFLNEIPLDGDVVLKRI